MSSVSMSPGCAGGGASVLRRALDAQWAAVRRARWLRGAAINAAVLLVLAADLSCKCAEYTGPLHWAEAALAGVAGANLLRLALALLRAPRPSRARLPPAQRRQLGLSCSDFDSSFVSESGSVLSDEPCDSFSSEETHTPLSARREWRGGAGGGRSGRGSPAAGGAGGSPSAPAPGSDSPPADRPAPDHFIADRQDLANYLQQYSERQRMCSAEPGGLAGWGGAGGGGGGGGAAPSYQLAAREEPAAEGGADEALQQAWARLHLDPTRLTQFNLNLRLWLHVTLLERLVAQMAAADRQLARAGLEPLGEQSGERLAALARGPHAPPALRQLLPFLAPFPDQRYAVRRVRELARGGCLSEYRWAGGGAGWDARQPPDAELLLRLLAAYLDVQLPAGQRAFSAAHVSAAPAPPPALGVHRVALSPPHYVLALGGDTLELCRGRNNLLHTLLLLLAAAARRDPPALCRLHLGPAGLNMLWIIGR